MTALLRNLRRESRWKKVHAAEGLISQGYARSEVLEAFRNELAAHSNEPRYRIGIWRVLARATPDREEHRRYLRNILNVFRDPEAPDRVHAAESLAKLHWLPSGADTHGIDPFLAASRSGETPLAVYAAWVVANVNPAVGQTRLAELLDAPDAGVRAAAAYALRLQSSLLPSVSEKIRRLAEAANLPDNVRLQLVCAACVHAPPEKRETWKARVRSFLDSAGPEGQQYHACMTLAEVGDVSDVPLLRDILKSGPPDARTGAAVALLRIDRRRPRSLAALDWIVIIAYGIGMLVIGWLYARKTRTQDDYLLGGRNMRPWTVGLSLFATLLSTISYLAIPGEMIKHGPMIISSIFVLPVIGLIVGWGLIPFFMRLEVTTAYEILEKRLGVSVRLLGSLFFLVLRLMWMAVIIYATTSKVLAPLLGLPETAVPWVCAILGMITVAYTSMGGLRAVVMTDVIQTFILFSGALLAIALITLRLGGISAWWPHSWAPTWDPLRFWFDPSARITVAGVWLSTLVWYVCTAGSDQMAIQRYLATRDARAARRMYFTSLAANAAVYVFLASLGLALFAFFRARPYLIPDGATLSSYADRLFTRFIVSGLPSGISGLIIAGLLAAAMSSLSSGINSSCSVLTVDFAERFHWSRAGKENVRLARTTSWAVGVIVVVMSAGVVFVQGNLLEVTYKVVNLLVTPLFILFFMALFVPRATVFATWVAAAASTTAAIGIAFFHWFGLSFIWIMPVSLLAGALSGTVTVFVSAAPGKPAGHEE